MTKSSLGTVLAAAATLAMVGAVTPAAAADGKEKCYGVSKAGKNDCGNGAHSCAGNAATDNAGDEWVYVPKGLCDKLAGGSTTPKG